MTNSSCNASANLSVESFGSTPRPLTTSFSSQCFVMIRRADYRTDRNGSLSLASIEVAVCMSVGALLDMHAHRLQVVV